jgi:two-component system CheB/CheR fusion protein
MPTSRAYLAGKVGPYGLTLATIALAAALQAALRPILHDTAQYMLFLLAVTLAAALGGAGPGLAATALGALAGMILFVRPHGGPPPLGHPDDIVLLLVFLVVAITLSLMAGRLHAVRREAQHQALAAADQARFPDENPAPVLRVGPDGQVLYANPAARSLMAECQSRQPGIPETMHQAITAALAGGARELEMTCGQQILSFMVVPVRQAYANLYGRDITQPKRAQEELLRAKQEWECTFDSVPDLIAIIDADHRIVRANRAMANRLGSTAQQCAGQYCYQCVHGLEQPLDHCPHALSLADGKSHVAEVHEPRLGGDFLISCTPMFDEQGRPFGSVHVARDITERKRIEEQLRAAKCSAEEAKAAAERANAAKDQFLAVLSHELRTPLTPVLAGVSVLQKDPHCGPDRHQTLEMIRRNVEMEARLIDDLLDVTRIARGKVKLDRRVVPICAILEQAAEVCKPNIEARRLRFDLEIKDRPHLIYADAGRMQQVFWNLITNAVKFTRSGGRVRVRCWREEGAVIATVNDTGIGIEPEAMLRIFRPFEQGGGQTTQQFGGLGLGLTISKALVEMHGGAISAYSDGKGKGATFRVRLPLYVGAEHAPPFVPNVGARQVSPLRILLVEDHGDTARMMRQLLMMDGHDVTIAGDVATALEEAAQRTFDLIVSDLGLPDASGVDLMRELRLRGYTMPGIALSGYGQDQDIQRSREAGFAAHLTKPTSPERLAEAIAATIAASTTR